MLHDLETDNCIKLSELSCQIVVGGARSEPDLWVCLFGDVDSRRGRIDTGDKESLFGQHRGGGAATTSNVHYLVTRL